MKKLAVISMKTCLLILGTLTIAGCSTGDDNPILYQNNTLHNFSSLVEQDSFKIHITGPSIKEGLVKFQIIKKDGEILLDEEFSTTFLLDYGVKDNATDQEKEEYIKGRIDTFFNENNFRQPAIDAKAIFDENYSKREIWDDIISDQTAIGFKYLLGKEDGRHIAYSKKLKKAVLYFNCC